jgi:DNA-directed RNA polymerase specialized sigma24 family protein
MTESEADRRRRFEALFASHRSDVVAYCGWRAASPSDAQDAVAEVFLTAWRRFDDLSPRATRRACGCMRRPGG